jgi:hypothetical protein
MSTEHKEPEELEYIEALAGELLGDLTSERLKSYYLRNPDVIHPALHAIHEANWQMEQGHHSAALLFYVSAVEVLFKAVIVRPLIFVLVQQESLAEAVAKHALQETRLVRYNDLVDALCHHLAKVDVKPIRKEGDTDSLRAEMKIVQDARNAVLHRGERAMVEQAQMAKDVAVTTYDRIVKRMLYSLDLNVVEHGRIVQF